MNEPKDDLLAAFENPESVSSEEAAAIQGTPVAPAAEAPVAPAVEASTIPEAPYTPVNTVSETPVAETPVAPAPEAAPVVDNIMPAEFQNAPEATPIPEAPQAPVIPEAPVPTNEVVAPDVPAPVMPEAPAPAQPTETPVAETPAPEANQNTPEHVSEEPAVTVKNTVSSEQDDPNFLKKNIKFIIIFCLIIAVFIIFLPKILSLLSGGAY